MGGYSRRRGFTLVELLVVVVILAVLIALLLPVLSRARKSAAQSQLESLAPPATVPMAAAKMDQEKLAGQAPPLPLLAHVSTFSADIVLTPRLSVGTAEPESIYEAKFAAKLDAAAPALLGNQPAGETQLCRVELPLPPQIISLADLAVTIDGVPSDAVTMQDDKLVWQGTLRTGQASSVDVKFAAVGRGLYSLQTPPGKILETFKIRLTAAGSDVRMLELSMQPTELTRADGQTVYTWDYRKLMFGRPIALDVLGIAPIDRLGELSWLGPMSVVAFGLVIGLVAHAANVRRFDRWMLLLVLGTFAGAYPLMYFAQEFVTLDQAIIAAGVLVVVVIGWRSISIMGWRLGIVGVILPAALIMACTLTAALRPPLQGILLTGMALALFILAMMLAPRLKWTTDETPPVPPQPMPAA